MGTGAWGIDDGYWDAGGTWHDTSAEIRAALRAAMGVDEEMVPPAEETVRVYTPGQFSPLAAPAELTLEDGTVLQLADALPPDLPLGYHRLQLEDDRPSVLVIATPGACHLPADLRAWGWAAQVYAVRSSASWGMGDLDDVERLARWSVRDLGARVLLINPICAVTPLRPQQASPYFPSSRRFANPLYLHVEALPGAAEAGREIEKLAAAGRALNERRHIDRDAVFALKQQAFELLWRRFAGDPGFDDYCRRQGRPLAEFATYAALAEHHGSGWRQWPSEHRRMDTGAVARFALERSERVRFHQWLQWLLDQQVARVAAQVPLMQDLPIGVDPNGADAWVWQDVLADGVSVGAPPDAYNARGQDWGFPPFVPHRLRAAGYEPFIQTIRANLRRGGALRIDHVMGFFRLFWIPIGSEPGQGTYVRYAPAELLAILALESHRAGAYVVGEDLGTVEDGVRETLAAQRLLSYRLLWFEAGPPAQYPPQALAAVTTHDLPTIAGIWTGADLAAQRGIGLSPSEEGAQQMRWKLRQLAHVADDAAVDAVVESAHRALAAAPCAVLTATLDDALAVTERPNMPGTTDQWPNWCLALPKPLEEIEREPLAHQIAAALRER